MAAYAIQCLHYPVLPKSLPSALELAHAMQLGGPARLSLLVVDEAHGQHRPHPEEEDVSGDDHHTIPAAQQTSLLLRLRFQQSYAVPAHAAPTACHACMAKHICQNHLMYAAKPLAHCKGKEEVCQLGCKLQSLWEVIRES